ncbi:hypothetical protein HCB37_05040 [Listeria booriae]|uniref:abortive infection system toxin AbiGii family protein n=1 Tax=Listeria booriae TaxID=1552123 RepID=UPI001628F376|nr:abortive infection system toxin AbiGii family protein [Listeria booriae]MBC1973740.1 hypothetical protein [Listeria booriae]MBC2031448.1 hypothetical protein [Listeria booriae]MBC2263880.1 hypothetical protein [Listeria booriae]
MKFKKALKQPKQGEIFMAPKEFLEHLNTNAPSGTHYETEDGIHFQLLDDEGFTLRFSVKLPDNFRGIDIKSSEDFSTLLYRSQQKIEISDVKYLIGENEVEPERAIEKFGEKIDFSQAKYFILPVDPSPEPQKIPIKFGMNKYDVLIKHDPYPSLEEIRFKSIEEDIFNLKMTINTSTKKVNFTLTYNFQNAISLDSILRQKTKLLDYATGNVNIFGKDITIKDVQTDNSIVKMIDFYEKLEAISRKMEVEFDLKHPIMLSDYINLNKLYYSFIEGSFYYLSKDIESYVISLESIHENLDELLKNNIGITGYELNELTLLNHNFDVYEQFIFKEGRYSGMKEDDLYTFDVLGDKIMYQKLFLKENRSEEIDFNIIVTELSDAREILIDERN